MIYIGSNDINAIYIGTQSVRSVYLGSTLIWPFTPSENIRTPLTSASRSIHSGHSLTDAYVHEGPWPGNFRNIAKSVFPDFNDDGDGAGGVVKSTIPGSTLNWRWDHPTTPVDARLNIDQFDTMMITEAGPPPRVRFPANDEQLKNTLTYLMMFIENQINNGRGQDTLIWSIWPDLSGWTDATNPSYPKTGWAELGGFEQCIPYYAESFKYFAEYATWKIKQTNPSVPEDYRVWMIPGHAFMNRVRTDANAGLLEGITSINDLFSPNDPEYEIIHPTSTLGYGLACFVFTCLYNVNLREENALSPVYIQPEYTDHRGTHPAVPQSIAEYFWDLSWELANLYESVGLGGTYSDAQGFDPLVDDDPLAEDPVDPGSIPAGYKVLVTPTEVTGATFTPALPAAVNGYRALSGTNPHVASLTQQGAYMAAALRLAEGTAVSDVIRLTNNATNQWDSGSSVLAVNRFVGGELQVIRYFPEETIGSGVNSTGQWITVEFIVNGTEMTINAGSGDYTFTASSPVGTTNLLALIPQFAGDIAGFVLYDNKPSASDRESIRNWMNARIAETT